MKENDWIVAGINNPDMSVGEFRTMGMDMSNTLMLSKDDYKKSKYILNLDVFKDSNGLFSDLKFDQFYNQKLNEFKLFYDIDSGYQYDMFDYRRYRKPNALVKNPELKVFLVTNPSELTVGHGWINSVVESPLSIRELAEKNKVYDSATGLFLDYSPNEHALVKNPLKWFSDQFKDTLVLATYDKDEDEVDPLTGRIIHHTKGEYKLNSDGKYYYETLNGRSLAGKQVLSAFDTLTVDGEGLNSIDFFDSDDKEKSIAGSIMKGVAAITPMVIGGSIGTAYSAGLVARELLKTLPMIDGLLGSISGNDNPTAFTRLSNTIAGKMTALTGSTSDYALQDMINAETLTSLLTDVALQWGLQKTVAKAVAKLRGQKQIIADAESNAYLIWKKESDTMRKVMEAKGNTELQILKLIGNEATWKESDLGRTALTRIQKEIAPKLEQLNRMGADASLLYMALVSNTDVYQTMLEHGCTKREAMAVTLGSTLSMFGIDRELHLGEIFFDELTADAEKSIRATLRKESSGFQKTLSELAKSEPLSNKKISNIITKSRDKLSGFHKSFFEKLKTHTWKDEMDDTIMGYVKEGLEKGLGEGIEEMSEELAADVSKLIYEWLAENPITDKFFNDLTTTDVGAFNSAFDNPEWFGLLIARYGMNFLGGLMGGPLFHGVNLYNNYKENGTLKRNTAEDLLIYNVRNFGKNEVLKILSEFKEKGKLGSTDLSTDFEMGQDGPVYLSATNGKISQNDWIFNQLKHEIDCIDAIIGDKRIYSDTELFGKLTLGEARFQQLAQMLANEGEQSSVGSYSDDYLKRYTNLVNEYIRVTRRLDLLNNPPTDAEARNKNNETLILKLTSRLKELSKQIDDFTSGANAIDYMGRILFLMDTRLNEPFYNANFGSWLLNVHRLSDTDEIIDPINLEDFINLSEEEQSKLRDEYLKYKETNQKNDKELAWEFFKYIRDLLSPEFLDIQSKVKVYRKYLDKVQELFDNEKNPFSKIIEEDINKFTEDSEDETYRIDYDSYLNGESEDDYANRNKREDEDEDVFKKRREVRLNKLKALKKAEVELEVTLNALQEVLDIVENAGSILDKATKRRLLLPLQYRLKDIIKEKLRDFSKFFSPKILKFLNDKLDSFKSDLSNWDEIVNDVVEIRKKEQLDELKRQGNLILELRKKLPVITSFNNFDVTNDVLLYINALYHNLKSLLMDFNNSLTDEEKFIFQNEETHLYEINYDELLNAINAHPEILQNDIFEQFINSSNVDLNLLQEFLGDINEDFNYTQNVRLLENKLNYNLYRHLMSIRSIQDIDEDGGLYEYNGSDYNFTNFDLDNIFLNTNGWLNILDINTFFSTISGINLYNIVNLKLLISDTLLSDQEIVQQLNDNIEKNTINDFNSEKEIILSDTIYDYIQKIQSTTPVENPLINIIKKLSLVFNKPSENVESLLESLFQRQQKEEASNFTLTAPERDALQEAEDLLRLGQAFVYAAYNSDTEIEPYLHNQLMMTVAKEHGIDIGQYPIIDDDIANVYYEQFNMLLDEIGLKDDQNGYTIGSWRYWDLRNQANKALKFVNARSAYIKSKLQIFSMNSDKFKVKFADTGEEFDLLDGYESDEIKNTHNLDEKLHKIEYLFHKNITELLKSHSLTEIFEASGLNQLVTSSVVDKLEFQEQNTSTLDENMSYKDLTSYDKMLYLLVLAGLDPKKFESFLKSFTKTHNNLVPLDIQQQVSRVAMALSNNVKLFHEGLEYFYSLANFEKRDIHTLLYGVSISGNGGAGKTEVIARQNIDFLIANGKKSENIILTGPSLNQTSKLEEIGQGKTMLIDDLVKLIMGDKYESFSEELKLCLTENKVSNTATYFIHQEGINTFNEFKSDVKLEKREIDAIIIDETTHIPIEILSLFSTYAKQHSIPFILIGDNLQSGYVINNSNSEKNINAEIAFVARASRLGITLRDGNILKQEDLRLIATLLRNLTSLPSHDDDYKTKFESLVKEALNNLSFTYYKGLEINGDYVTSTFTVDNAKKIIGKSKPTATNSIIYVGNNQEIILLLQQTHGSENVRIFNKISDVLGQECENIVIDIDWNQYKDYREITNIQDQYEALLKFLKDLYTLSSRGKTSAVFIDRNNKLQDLIEFKQESHKNAIKGFDENTHDNFVNVLNAYYDSIGITETVEEEKPSETTTEEFTEQSAEEGKASYVEDTGKYERFDLKETGKSLILDTAVKPVASPKSINGVNESISDDMNDVEKRELQDTIYDIDKITSDIHEGRVYSSASFAGLDFLLESPGSHNRIYLVQPVKEGEVLEDLSCFVPHTNSLTYYKPQIFNPNSETSGTQFKTYLDLNMDDPIFKLLALKSAFLYNNTVEELGEDWFDDKPMSRETFEEILKDLRDHQNTGNYEHFKIQISRRTSRDNFVGLTGLDEEKSALSYNEKENTFNYDLQNGLVLRLILLFKNKNGLDCQITLGLLANPLTYINEISNIEKVVKLLEAKFEDIKKKGLVNDATRTRINQKLQRIKKYLADLKSNDETINPAKVYQRHILGLINLWKRESNGNSNYQLITNLPGTLDFTGTTDLSNVLKGEKKSVKVVRLSRYSNDKLEGSSLQQRGTTYEVLNPYVRRSSVKIVLGLNHHHLYPKASGRAAILVTKNFALFGKSDVDLERAWRNSINADRKPVRLQLCENLGVSLSHLIDRRLRKLFDSGVFAYTNKEDKSKTTVYDQHTFNFENKPTAIRMLISLHNWRASLLRFYDVFDHDVLKDGIFHELYIKDRVHFNYQLDLTLKLLNEFYQEFEKTLPTDKNELKKISSLQKENMFRKYVEEHKSEKENFRFDFAKAVWDFNEKLNSLNIRIFRLGSGPKNQYQVRKILGKLESQSQDNPYGYTQELIQEGIYGLYLTPTLAEKYIDIAEHLFEDIINHKYLSIWKKVSTSVSQEGRVKVDPREYVYAENNFKSVGETYALYELADGLPYLIDLENHEAEHNVFAALPRLIIDTAARAVAWSKTKVDSETGRHYVENVGEWATHPRVKEYDSEHPDIHYWSRNTDIVRVKSYKLNEDTDQWEEDYKKTIRFDLGNCVRFGLDMFDFLSLAFHGTTDEFIERKLNGTIVEKTGEWSDLNAQVTGSYYWDGFRTDPMFLHHVTHTGNYHKAANELALLPAVTDESLLGVQARPDSPLILMGLFKPTINPEDKSKSEKLEETELVVTQDNKILQALRTLHLNTITSELNTYQDNLEDTSTFTRILSTVLGEDKNKIKGIAAEFIDTNLVVKISTEENTYVITIKPDYNSLPLNEAYSFEKVLKPTETASETIIEDNDNGVDLDEFEDEEDEEDWGGGESAVEDVTPDYYAELPVQSIFVSNELSSNLSENISKFKQAIDKLKTTATDIEKQILDELLNIMLGSKINLQDQFKDFIEAVEYLNLTQMDEFINKVVSNYITLFNNDLSSIFSKYTWNQVNDFKSKYTDQLDMLLSKLLDITQCIP